MSYVYNTTTKQVQVTAASTARALHDDIQTTFAGSTYMQYLIPDSGAIKDALYLFQNGWTFDTTTSSGYMTTGGWQFSTGTDKWTNVQAISGDSFTGIQVYYAQGGAPVNFAATGLPNALIKVRTGGTDVNSQAYTVYQRTFQKRYSQFNVTASSGGVDTVPLTVSADPLLTIASGTLSGWADVSAAWAACYRSAFDTAAGKDFTLNGSHTNSVTTITVNESTASMPASGTLAIGNSVTQEIITYTGKGSFTFTGCTRGTNRTTAASYASGQKASGNTFQYNTVISTTNSAHTLVDMYNWIQYKLGLSSDMDVLAGGHTGQTTPFLVTMASASSLVTVSGVWIENYASADANKVQFTDLTAAVHTPPSSISVAINFDAAIAGGQVAVFALNTTGLTDATYTTANILSTIINAVASGTSASTSLTYTADIPVRVIVRKPGYQQFSLYTTITSAGLSVTAQNPADSAY
jgi:hypothetical protein